MKRFTLTLFFLTILLAACTAPNVVQTLQGVEPLRATSLPETSRPKKTRPAPTSPAPTDTQPASPTPSPTATITSTITPTPTPTSPPTATINPTLAFFQDAGVGDNVDGLGTARLLVINQSGAAQINIFLKGITLKRAQPTYYDATITRSAVIEILWGSYQVLVQIPGRGSLTAAYVQRGKDKTTLIVGKDKLTIIGP